MFAWCERAMRELYLSVSHKHKCQVFSTPILYFSLAFIQLKQVQAVKRYLYQDRQRDNLAVDPFQNQSPVAAAGGGFGPADGQ